jgi:hypothetical protein
MAATPQQIASARALASSRGYDPNLVDADNADRANTAFPAQTGGYTGGAGYKPPAGTPLTAPATGAMGGLTSAGSISRPSGPFVPTSGTSPVDTKGAGGAVPGGSSLGSGPSAGGSATPDLSSFGGGAGGLMSESMPPSQSQAMGPLSLRQGLGNRMYPQETDAHAALRKIY